MVGRFVQSHDENIADYSRNTSDFGSGPVEARANFESKVLKRPWKALVKECGSAVQPGGKFASYIGA